MHTKLQNYLAEKLPEYLDLLKTMVDINSFTVNPEGVNAVGEVTAQAFIELGFTAEMIQAENPNFGKHLVLTRKGKSGRKIGLVGHLDTVFSAEEEIEHNFHWRPEGHRIYGPGTEDMKGGNVLILMTLDALRTFAPTEFEDITWVVMFNAAEERLSQDFGELCRQRLDGALANLVFEAGALSNDVFKLVVARKGKAEYRVTATGRSAHAGNGHQTGANAIIALAEALQRVAALTDYARDLTFNVGTVSGGSVTNRVPHFAEAQVEMRTFDPQVFEEGIASMLALAGASEIGSADGDFACEISVDLLERDEPWGRNEATDSLFEIWRQSADFLDMTATMEERGGLSDGNHTWQFVPTMDGLGPAGANAHSSERSEDGSKEQEYVIPSSFVPKAMLNVTALLKLIH